MSSKNTICVWYDGAALDAAKFYAETFPDSSVDAVHYAPGDYPSGKQGDVLTVEFTVMGVACLGMVASQSLLAASVWQPLLYVPHVLLLACAQPFWQASEQVLNQRALDLYGDLADRIVVREWTLWAFRCAALLAFWWLVQDWSATQQLVLGVALMALATVSEWLLARRWLRRT